ncbi:MAG: S-layer homology domain-containing protein [Dysosmobacter sp.]|nr:S-layer homology domain-containing protein [Dysosmobacter sp.]
MKKFLSLVLALVMTMSLVTISAGAKDFTDDDKITYEEAVAVVSEIGVVDGYADGKFNPTNTLTRQAAAKIICNLILGPTTAAELHADTAPYKDVPATSQFAGYIAYCAKEGIISGYADGTFKPGNTLTGYAFMKMLLGALGYDAEVEGYTGANWSINVAKQAINIGLNKSLEGEFNGIKAVTREEACLYAFNTLKADMVEYDSKTSVTVGGAEVVIAGSEAKAQTWKNSATRKENIKDDAYIQFAEQYFNKLILDETTDVFGRPARKWTYKSEEIGTYVNYDVLVDEYTSSVSAKEVYDVIGKTAMDKFDLDVVVDGNAKSAIVKEISKTNKDDLTDTGTGVLTQVFVDEDNKQATVTMINTYLAIADKDYNAKKDEVSFDVYGIKETSKGVFEKFDTDDSNSNKVTLVKESMSVSGDDFAIEDIEEDDAYLVTVADGEIQTLVEAEVIEDTEIASFKVGSNVTVDGTKYSFAETAEFDAETLAAYTNGNSSINLKDTTYNVYLDTYGNLIGIEEVDAVDNYVFITGADQGNSNLATKTTEANAIFLDGTSKVIDVSNTKGDGVTDSPVINRWFTYTVDKNDVYTLNTIKEDTFASKNDKVGQKAQEEGNVQIDKKHVSLEGNGDFKVVYGNASSIYLTASLKKVHSNERNYVVISGVDNVTTGVKNASIETWTEKEAQDDVKKGETWADTSYGVYTLFKDNGYVIAAVVVGEDAASTKNLVYAHTSGVELESYDKTEDEWTWTRKVIFEGEEITLTEKSDSLSELNKMNKGNWYQVKYNAEGNVISVELASAALANDQYKYITYFSDIEDAVEKEDTVLLDKHNITNELTLKGSTLYDNTDGTRGLAIDDDTKIVLIQKNNNKETTSYETGVKALEDALDDLNVDSTTKKVKFDISAIIEDGMATVVVLYDHVADGYTENDKPGSTDLNVSVANGVITVTGTKAEVDEVAAAVVDELNDRGYTDVKVSVGTKTPAEGETAGEPEITGVQATKNSITYTFKFVDQTTSAAAK